jgi:hypothetical protein
MDYTCNSGSGWQARVQSSAEASMTHQFDVVVEKDSDGYFVATVIGIKNLRSTLAKPRVADTKR